MMLGPPSARVGTRMSAEESVLGGLVGSGTWIWIRPAPPAPPLLFRMQVFGPVPVWPQHKFESPHVSMYSVDPCFRTGPEARIQSRTIWVSPLFVKSTCVADSRIT